MTTEHRRKDRLRIVALERELAETKAALVLAEAKVRDAEFREDSMRRRAEAAEEHSPEARRSSTIEDLRVWPELVSQQVRAWLGPSLDVLAFRTDDGSIHVRIAERRG